MSTTLQRGLAPVRQKLDNQTVVIAKHSPATPAVTVHASFAAGSIYDPPGRSGLAHFVSKVIDRGTSVMTGDEIAEELENRGVALAVSVNRHALQLVLTCLVDDLDTVLAILSDIVREPTFPDGDVQTKRGEIITTIRQDEDNPAAVSGEALLASLYGERHPYGWRPRGSVDSVETTTRAELQAFHARRIAPSTLSLVMVGDVDPNYAMEAANRAFGDWDATAGAGVDLPEPPPMPARVVKVIPMMNKAQTDISYGFAAVRRSDPAYYAFWLMNNILGQYSLGGRLGDSIRERQGMAYYVYSSLDATFGQGPFSIRAGVAAANVERTIASIDAELAAIVEKGFTAQEIDESKSYMIGSLPRQLETNAAIASFLLSIETFGLGLDYDERLPKLIGDVTKEAAEAAARRLLVPSRATVAVAGPWTPAAP
jgi:zinc protease